VSAKRTDKCSQRDKSRADPSENDAEHRLDQCSQSNQQVLMEDNWLSEHNSSADLSLKLYATQYAPPPDMRLPAFESPNFVFIPTL